MPLEPDREVPLAPRTTLRLGGPAAWFVSVRSEHDLLAALRWANERDEPHHLLGGGSNLLVPDRGVSGLVIAMESRGITHLGDGLVEAAAGEPWDAFVEQMVEADLAGVECLAGIPGLVGATPIQNVGAYGQDVSETIESVRCYDLVRQDFVERSNAECEFAYRDSDFKRNPGRFIVTRVRFRLQPGGGPALRYGELLNAAGASSAGTSPSLREARQLVLSSRRRKSMVLDASDPNTRSAGSFFTNPVISEARFSALRDRWLAADPARTAETLPHWTVPGGIKLAAGWLIEQAGFPRGTRRGPVGQSTAHALALVHFGGGSTAQLLAFADEIVSAVNSEFGVELDREPRLFG